MIVIAQMMMKTIKEVRVKEVRVLLTIKEHHDNWVLHSHKMNARYSLFHIKKSVDDSQSILCRYAFLQQ
jgi:hypothetical protein